MRYTIYSYIKEMINTLIEAAQYIESCQNKEVNFRLLLDSNNVLDKVENVLMGNYGSLKSSHIFETLSICKQQLNKLRHLHEDGENINIEKAIYTNEIKALENMYINCMEVTYQIVFFAELGQKWDSMNSVYVAFKKRKNCNVKVVLTPIFREVQSNENIKKDVIYQDYLTQMGISFIPYEQYDISKDLPDIAFISNPYESVTVPQFWPENISKYTRLVYLPYYTGLSIDNSSIQVHCGMPIAKYAWRIIAQSQKIKQLHKKFAPKKGENVLVTGLSKWDEIFLINKNSIDEDINWKEKLNGKKVFLWNSHYNVSSSTATLLENGKEIIELFSKRQDIGLIWRPHPMTETIFKLYLPEYSLLWEELKEKVKKSSNIVVDTNSSFKPAFQYSDALISDYSSLIAEYMMTGKPILWMKKAVTNDFLSNSELLIRIDSLEQSYSKEDIFDFIDRITKGIDLNRDIRMQAIKEDIPTFNGEIGEEICNLLLEEFHKETK